MKPNYFSIPKPCSEDWNQMDATEQGAFCSNCTKEVLNCSTLKAKEIKFKLENTENPCVRIYSSQLDELNFIEWFNHLSLKKQLKYLFLFALLFVFKFDSNAQEDTTLIQPQYVEIDPKDDLTPEQLIAEANYPPDTTDLEINQPELLAKACDLPKWEINPLTEFDFPIPLGIIVMGDYAMPPTTETAFKLPDFISAHEAQPAISLEVSETNYLAVGDNKYTFFIEEDHLIFYTNAQYDENIHLKIVKKGNGDIIYFSPIKIKQGQREFYFPLGKFENGTYLIFIENLNEVNGIELIYW